MASDDLSLLFRLRADNAQAKAAIADTRAAVASLRASFGNDLKGMQGAAKSALSDIGENVNAFVGQRIPLVGGAFLRITSNIKGLNDELKKGGPQTEKLAQQIESIAKASNKSTTEVARFLTSFVRLEGQAQRDAAALQFVGAAAAQQLIPQLEEAGTALAEVSTEAAGAGGAIAGMAGPIGIAVIAIGALALGAAAAAKQIFELAKASADYQGKLFDLSQQVGVSVETLSTLEVMARTTGGSIDSLAQSLGIFQSKLEEAIEDPGSKASVTFRQLNVDATDTETALRQTIAALARMPEGFRQTALALEVFGRGGKAFLAIAKESNGDIDQITEKLRGLGLVTTDQAKIADEFNDQLVLLEVQLRGLGTKAIPVVLNVLKDLSKTLEDNRVLINVLKGIVQSFAISLELGFKTFKSLIDPVLIGLQAIAAVVHKIREDIEFITGHPLPGFSSGAPPTAPTTPAPAKDPFTQQLENEVEARKKLQGVLNFSLAERQRQAEASIAQAQRELDAGKRTRKELLDATIDGTRKQTQAEIDGLEADRKIKLQEQALAKDDVEKRTQLSNAILAIDTQIANKRAAQTKNEADLRAKARLDEQKAELASQQANLETLTRLGQERIAVIEDLIKRERVDRETGLKEIEEIEDASLRARGQILKKELEVAGIGPDRQAVLDKIRALEADRTELERRQSERRRQLTAEEFEQKRQILLSGLDTLLQIEQVRGNARIATIQALAQLGVKTEEDAAKEILAIRLKLLDDEIEATKAKQQAAAGIIDPKERARTQAELTNALKILNAEREAVQDEGNREIEEGRQQDLENERHYADELEKIRERVRDIQRDSARTVIDLMVLHHARRRDIIRAEAELDIQDETDRHQRELDAITKQRQENAESRKTKEEKLEADKELNSQSEEEQERHQLRLQEIKDRQKAAESEADPFGRIGLGTENLKEFAGVLEDTIVPLGQILTNTFLQVSDAIGQTVQNWVLLGETGPAVMRKILAQALASLAAEAAVNAIKELALGFATLFFNPAESAAHFTAAGLWAAIGGVSAIAGRSVAGDLFKTKTGGAGGSTGSSGPGQLNPLDLERNTGQREMVLKLVLEHHVKSNDSHIVKTIVKDYQTGGDTRQVINTDGVLT